MESKSATVNLAETELLNLLDGGIPAANLELSHLSDETLLARAREGNIRIAETILASGKGNATTDNIDRDVNTFLDELQRRRVQEERRQAAPGRVGRFVGRCLKLGRN